jgi:hypothetical protein
MHSILNYLYFHGPTINGIGFWDSRPFNEICVLTGYTGDDCEAHVYHRAEKFRNTVYIVILAYCIYTFIKMFTLYLTVILPLTQMKNHGGTKVIKTKK